MRVLGVAFQVLQHRNRQNMSREEEVMGIAASAVANLFRMRRNVIGTQ